MSPYLDLFVQRGERGVAREPAIKRLHRDRRPASGGPQRLSAEGGGGGRGTGGGSGPLLLLGRRRAGLAMGLSSHGLAPGALASTERAREGDTSGISVVGPRLAASAIQNRT